MNITRKFSYKMFKDMESKNELKEIGIKNRACYYFDDTINGTDIDFGDIFLDEKLFENIFQLMTFHMKFQRVHKHCVYVQ